MRLYSRVSFVALAIPLIAAGCAATIAPPKSIEVQQASERIRSLPIGLTKFITIPQERIDLLFFPDDEAVSQEDQDGYHWRLIPSSKVIPVTDLLLMGLQHAGFRSDVYPNLSNAKANGARVGILGVVKKAEVIQLDRPAPKGFFELIGNCMGLFSYFSPKCIVFNPNAVHNDRPVSRLEALCELQVSILNLNNSKILWEGPVTRSIRGVGPTPFGTNAAKVKTDAALGLAESDLHPLRVMMSLCYHQAAMDLVARLNQIFDREAL